MYVDLPSTGCNILNTNNTFYNYSQDRHTRQTWAIYDGKAFLSSVSTSSYGYEYSGTCLSTGDLVYKPEYKEVLFPFLAFLSFLFILGLVYKIIIKRLMP